MRGCVSSSVRFASVPRLGDFMAIGIREAGLDDMSKVRALFIEYQQWLNVDLCFQGFEEELAALPGCYAPPEGVIYLAVEDGEPIGCVAVRPRTSDEAELKRLYVRSAHRGRGGGKRLFDAAMTRAHEMDYSSIVLDTLPHMRAAKSLYAAYGFRKIPSYYNNPEEGAEYYRCEFADCR